MRTYSPRAGEVRRNWRVIDAAGRPLGRVASEIATILRGKDKPTYTPHMDTGDFVVVVNAAKVRVTGRKLRGKVYYSHSMYPGGLKAVTLERMLARHPRRVIEYAVWGMLPKNRLGRALMRKLKVYAEETHPHMAQVKEHARPPKAGRPRKKPARGAQASAPTPAPARAPAGRAPARGRRAPQPAEAPEPVPVAEAREAAPAAPEAPPAEPEAVAAAEPQPTAEVAEAPAPTEPTGPEPPPIRRVSGQPRSRRARAQSARQPRSRGKSQPAGGAPDGEQTPRESGEQSEEA